MAAPIDLGNVADFDKFLDDSGTQLVVVHFWAAWAPQCQQMNDVMAELAKDTKIKAKYGKVEAEAVPEVSMRYVIEAVPTCVLLRHKRIVDRVNGANAPELTTKVQQHAKASGGGPPPAAKAPVPKEDLDTRLKKLINSAPVMLFMKGVPEEPRCGFSRTMIGLLNEQGVKYSTFNILADEEVRAGLKKFSNWPTYPQLYVSGELLGGLDIVKEMIEGGEFKDAMPKQESLEDRLKALINKDKVVVFMKGNPEQPRCGFSKTLVGIFNETKVPYGHFDILQDEEVRQGLKSFSNWPTYPQVYVNGDLVGGLDIIKELQESDELISTLKGE